MKLVSLLLFFVAIQFNSCTTEPEASDFLNETAVYSIAFNPTQSRADFTGKIKRIKIKRKRVGVGFKVVGLVNSSTAQFNSFAILLEGDSLPEGCSNDEEWLITPRGPANNNGIVPFKGEVDLPSCVENVPVKLTATPLNENGEQADEAEVLWVTPQDNDGIDLVKASSKIRADGESRRFIFRIDGEFVYSLSTVEITSQSFENGIATSEPTEPKKIKRGEINTGDSVEIIGFHSTEEWTASPTSIFTLRILDEADQELETMQVVVDNQPFQEAGGIVLRQPVIKEHNNGNFRIKVPLAGQNRSDVTSVDVMFSDYSGPEPTPTEITLFKTGENNVTDIYADNTFTFDDPTAAVGEIYTIIIDLKDNEGNSIRSYEETVTVQ